LAEFRPRSLPEPIVAAKAFGLTVQAGLLARADEVIE
jgi:hypothetical protein